MNASKMLDLKNISYTENLSFIRKYRSIFKNLRSISCPSCQMNDFEHLFSIEYLNFVKCNTCGLVYINPCPMPEDLFKVYSKGLKEWTTIEAYIERKMDLFRDYLMKVEAVKEKRGRILDVGCSIGLFLKIARNRGWDIYGVDVSHEDVKYAKRNYNITVFEGTIKGANYPNDFFDVITMWDFIEHIPEPISCLKEVKRILKKDGMLFILTGNIESREAKQKGIYWPFLGGGTHLIFYSPQTIRKNLDIAGLKAIRLSTYKKSEGFHRNVFRHDLIGVTVNFIRNPKRFLGIIKKMIQYNLFASKWEAEISSSMLVIAKKKK